MAPILSHRAFALLPLNSRMNATRDDFSNFAKFNVATVANGKVYVPTMSKTIAVFGELQ